MDWLFIGAAAVSAWAVLSVLGNERQRKHDAATVIAAPPPAALPAESMPA